jgi:hypothetical protein
MTRLGSRVYVKVIGLGDEGRQPDSMREEELARALRGMS